MTATRHDAHARPPDILRNIFKQYQKMSRDVLDSDPNIIDTGLLMEDDRARGCEVLKSDLRRANTACEKFLTGETSVTPGLQVQYFEIKALPGGHYYSKLA